LSFFHRGYLRKDRFHAERQGQRLASRFHQGHDGRRRSGSGGADAGRQVPSTANGAEPAVEVAPATPAKPLPSIQLGSYRLSRLVAGANPLHGGSYQGSHATHCMKEYFTPERQVEFLQRCELAGITAHQFSNHKNSEYVRVARDCGVKMSFFGLRADVSTIKDAIKSVQPIALVHHGGVTDRLFAEGKHQQVRDFVKAVHDGGVMAGVSAHYPDCIKRIADEGWDVDEIQFNVEAAHRYGQVPKAS